uniref:DM domain-containing protein n=1 Tax=Enterobius vermicularis TaxID=51028 RepID=A0A0N4VK48_ENTVE
LPYFGSGGGGGGADSGDSGSCFFCLFSERVPNCQKCGQHGRKSRLKGHKRVCPYKECSCAKCQVVSERQKLMADQIKIRRRQRKDTLMNFTRKKITDTLNAAAVVAATNPMPYLSNFNALLYKQLQQNLQPPTTGILPCSSPTGSSAADSSAYSPTNSVRYFTPSPTDVQKVAVNSHIQTPIPQLPLLFSTPSVTLPSSSTNNNISSNSNNNNNTTSTHHHPSALLGAPQIAVPIAINPLLAGCSTSTTLLTDTFSKANNSNITVEKQSQQQQHHHHHHHQHHQQQQQQQPTSFSLGLQATLNNKTIVESFLANMRLLEQKIYAGITTHDDPSNTVVDVCTV